MTPEERQAKIARLQKIERIKALEGSTASSQPNQQAQGEPILPNQYEIGRKAVQAMSQPSPYFKGGEQIRKGNIPAGVTNVITGMAQAPFIPIGGAIEGIRQIPYVGNAAANFVSSPFNAVNQLYDVAAGGIQKGLDYLGVPQNIQNLGMSPQNAQQTSEALSSAGKTALSYAVPSVVKGLAPGVGRAYESVGTKLENLSKSAEMKSIKPTFTPKKGLEPMERQVATATEGNYAPTEKGLAKLVANKERLLSQSQGEIARAKANEITINANQTKTVLDQKLARAKNRADYQEIKSAVEDAKARIDQVASQYSNGEIPFDAAWELKSSFQNMVADKYDQFAGTQKEAYKIAGNILLKDLTAKAPNLRNLGIKERNLIELEGTLTRKVAQSQKENIIDWRKAQGMGLAVGAGAIAGSPLLGAGVLGAEYALTNPRALHWEAVGLDRLARRINPNLPSISSPPQFMQQSAPQPFTPPQPTQPLYTKSDIARATNRPITPPIPQRELAPSLYTKSDIARARYGEPGINKTQQSSPWRYDDNGAMTNTAFNKGVDVFTVDDALNSMKQWKNAYKEFYDVMARKNPTEINEFTKNPQRIPQPYKEAAEGFIAKTLGTKHITYTPQDVMRILNQIKSGQ
jgi:hypothetical protein